MKIKKAIEILKAHNNWRRGHIEEMCLTPKEIGEAIDTVVEHCEQKTYTAEDMQDFAEWTAFMQWIYDPTDKTWFQKHSTETKTTAQLCEMWENESREK